jgi:hypothetical protein
MSSEVKYQHRFCLVPSVWTKENRFDSCGHAVYCNADYSVIKGQWPRFVWLLYFLFSVSLLLHEMFRANPLLLYGTFFLSFCFVIFYRILYCYYQIFDCPFPLSGIWGFFFLFFSLHVAFLVDLGVLDYGLNFFLYLNDMVPVAGDRNCLIIITGLYSVCNFCLFKFHSELLVLTDSLFPGVSSDYNISKF